MPDDKLISANALIEDLLNKDFYPAIVKRSIEETPAMDAIEVVRCKDCKYSSFVSYGSKYECEKIKDKFFFSNDFCSYGKRKID